MLAEIGLFALIVALVLTLVQSVVPLVGAYRRDVAMMTVGQHAALGQFVFTCVAFAILTWAFVVSDFSLLVVADNSHTAKPLIYKISGVWGNHEGSMLLWVLILSTFGAAVAMFGRNLPDQLRANVLSVQGMVGLGFLTFIVLTSNPFERLFPVPADGNGLNPVLQDPGLAIHPPFLYLGYVGFSIAFSFSVAALIEGKVDAAWARWVRPWVLAAWCFLTIGITLGSAWAYYTLGWGGWWFWDPVENASFMPWLAGTALLHCCLVVERRNALVSWTLLLGILTFSLSLVGTFLVRSGVLTSVHAFAQDPERGVFILVLLVLSTGGALALYTLRMPVLKRGIPYAPVSREAALTLNNVLLSVATGTVFVGTFYPLLIDMMTNDKISVGPPYYNLTFVAVMVPLLIAMVFGPFLRWKRDNFGSVLRRLRVPLVLALSTAAGMLLFSLAGNSFLAILGIALSVWLVVGSLAILAQRMKLGEASWRRSFDLLRSTPRSTLGLVIAHAGMGITVAGITGMSAWSTETAGMLRVGETLQLSGYTVRLDALKESRGSNFKAEQATFVITAKDEEIATLVSERRFYPVRRQQTTVAGIQTNFIRNIYVVLGESAKPDVPQVRFYYHPLAPWIWLGALAMALGGFVSLSDRRFRVGVAARSKPQLPLSPVEVSS